MAQGPDPNRNFDTDREMTPEELRSGGGPGDFRSSRLGLSSWGVAILAIILVAALVALMM